MTVFLTIAIIAAAFIAYNLAGKMKQQKAEKAAGDGPIPVKPAKTVNKGSVRWILAVIAILVLAALVFSSMYQLQEDQFAVITTFGNPSVVSSPGLKFKLPLIQKKTIVS